jgi:hypothetical protein
METDSLRFKRTEEYSVLYNVGIFLSFYFFFLTKISLQYKRRDTLIFLNQRGSILILCK